MEPEMTAYKARVSGILGALQTLLLLIVGIQVSPELAEHINTVAIVGVPAVVGVVNGVSTYFARNEPK